MTSLGFRNRLFLGLLSIALTTALSSSVLGYLGFWRSLTTNTEDRLEAIQSLATEMIDLSGAPRLRPDRQSITLLDALGEVRFRLRLDERTLLSFGGTYPDEAGWQEDSVDLEPYTLEFALNVEEQQTVLRTYLGTGLITLLSALAIAFVIGRLLYHAAMKPIRDLTLAVDSLSQQRIPQPVNVPSGKDELSQLAFSFNRMSTALARFLERERAFTRYASHELRTPLSNIKVLAEGVEQKLYSQEEIQQPLQDNINRIENILAGLLTMTRLSEVQLEPVLLNVAIHSVLRSLSEAQRKRIHVVNNASDPIVMGRDDLIQPVISNLLSNALKYSDDKVSLELSELDHHVGIRVTDKGKGVPEETLSKLTEPFFRNSQDEQGLGLGLALVQHVMDTLQGELSLINLRDGFEVKLLIPLVSEEWL